MLTNSWWTRRGRRGTACVLATSLVLGLGAPVVGGGGAENLLLVIDPTNAESMYIGNYYKNARSVPDRNVIYTSPGAQDYAAFVDFNLDALFGSLANLEIGDHIDYVLVLPGAYYRLNAGGYISDTCSPVNRFSASSVYTMAFLSSEILRGDLQSSESNRYYSSSYEAVAFDSGTGWLGGEPDNSYNARRYFIGALLGYSGERGNTLEEIIDMIDRSVAADGTRPAGTFYYMNTTDSARNVRAPSYANPYNYDNAAAFIIDLDGGGERINGNVPSGRHDCLGIMTGVASPDIDDGDFTILPGAFCDHLTSYAGHFDSGSQTKLSRWIAKGASGSHGVVEEPCNYTGKFPHARMHVYYFQGLSLGESVLRSHAYVPFQALFYGDPLTRPFAYLPEVTVPDAPSGPVSGTITLTPEAFTEKPGARVVLHDLYMDGRLLDTILDGQSFSLDTTALSDGSHDVRVVSYDGTPVVSQGRWIGRIDVDNLGFSATLDVTPGGGDLSSPFDVTVSAAGGTVAEIRVLQNNRVIAAAGGASGSFTLVGSVFGAGPVLLAAEAEFDDGRRALSEPILIEVGYENAPPGGGPAAPVAYSYMKDVPAPAAILLELPASDPEGDGLSYTIVSPPSQASIEGSGPFRLLRPASEAVGEDSLTFRVSDGQTDSNVATITLRYLFGTLCDLPGDVNGDGVLNAADIPGYIRVKLGEPEPGDDEACADFGTGSLDGDTDLFVAALLGA